MCHPLDKRVLCRVRRHGRRIPIEYVLHGESVGLDRPARRGQSVQLREARPAQKERLDGPHLSQLGAIPHTGKILYPTVYFIQWSYNSGAKCQKATFQPKQDPGHSHIEGETLQKDGISGKDPEKLTIQCFPLYSVLLALDKAQFDFFSLDVEGHELRILQTVPWHRVSIKVQYILNILSLFDI